LKEGRRQMEIQPGRLATKDDNNRKESKKPDYEEDKDQLEEEQGERTRELGKTTNQIF
jgi:hypothetical protein